MSAPSVGLIALWTGELSSNVEHMKNMCIHQMKDDELAQFNIFAQNASYSLASLMKYVQQIQENEQ